MKAIQRLIQCVLMAVLISGCSTVRIGYDQADHLGYWWIDRFLDLNADKSRQFKADLKALHGWHRQTQLPDYARLANLFATRMEGEITSGEVCEDIQAVRDKLEILSRQSLPIWARLSQQLGPEEIRQLRKKFTDDDKEWKEKWLDVKPEKVHRLRYEEWLDRAESLYGKASEEQKRIIQQAVSRSSWDARVVWERRQQRQQRIIITLEKIMRQHLGLQEAEAELKIVFDQLFNPDDQKQAEMQRKLIDEACTNLAGLHQVTNKNQRLRARQKFTDYADDFLHLARSR